MWIYIIVSLIVIIALISYLTNPFVRFSLIKDISKVKLVDGEIVLEEINSIKLRYSIFWRNFSKIKSAWHIVGNRFGRRNRSSSKEVKKIIEEIHEKRFDPKNMYLISGDHFSVFYPRSMGIFYHSILDPRTALHDDDWLNKQKIYLKTLSFALNVYSQSKTLSTTIVPTTPNSVILLNIYATPSDTLYSIFYAFSQLLGNKDLEKIYPAIKKTGYNLSTQKTAKKMLDKYQSVLKQHFKNYKKFVFDKKTGLIKKDILISGTKDIVRKQSGFYDNVIFWKTVELAQKLKIIEKDEEFLKDLKSKIIEKFFIKDGLFLEDLSKESIKNKWYSSDWLIAYQTGFLDVDNKADFSYLKKATQYVIDNKIDLPFPLRYHLDQRRNRLYLPVRIGAKDYGSSVIWSHWGTEFIKLLLTISKKENNKKFRKIAQGHLKTFEYNISRYRGYPEVYRSNGDFYTSIFYTSVRTTGWIISYEQALMMEKYL